MSCSSAARWTADGKTSLDDWPMFTSSFGWTSSPASAASTSLAFMFEEVPEPVWKTSIGNWSSSSPAATRSAAAAMRSALSVSSRPSSAFTRAAAPLILPSHRATGAGIGSPETVKLATALRVSPPQSSVRVSTSAIVRESSSGVSRCLAPGRVPGGQGALGPGEQLAEVTGGRIVPSGAAPVPGTRTGPNQTTRRLRRSNGRSRISRRRGIRRLNRSSTSAGPSRRGSLRSHCSRRSRPRPCRR